MGLRERGIVNRLQWASMEVAEQGKITSVLAGQGSNVNEGSRSRLPIFFLLSISVVCVGGGELLPCASAPLVCCVYYRVRQACSSRGDGRIASRIPSQDMKIASESVGPTLPDGNRKEGITHVFFDFPRNCARFAKQWPGSAASKGM